MFIKFNKWDRYIIALLKYVIKLRMQETAYKTAGGIHPYPNPCIQNGDFTTVPITYIKFCKLEVLTVLNAYVDRGKKKDVQ